MQTIENTFSTVTQRIGYGVVAKLANTAYQAVSRMAEDPRPGHKYRIRRRILDAVIEQAEVRAKSLEQEAQETAQSVIELKRWRDTEFVK